MLFAAQWQPPLGWMALTALLAIAAGGAVWLTYRAVVAPIAADEAPADPSEVAETVSK